MLKELLNKDLYRLDIETTGFDSANNAITSFCILKFNLNSFSFQELIHCYLHKRIDTKLNEYLCKTIDLETQEFRTKINADVYERNLDSIHSLNEFTTAIIEFVEKTQITDEAHVFCLHTEFDISFMQNYFNETKEHFPFSHRNIWELSSLLAGNNVDYLKIREDILASEEWIYLEKNNFKDSDFVVHTALFDCVLQTWMLAKGLQVQK